VLCGITTSILFDLGASDSFISPSLMEHCGLMVARHDIGWQVELATGSKGRLPCLWLCVGFGHLHYHSGSPCVAFGVLRDYFRHGLVGDPPS